MPLINVLSKSTKLKEQRWDSDPADENLARSYRLTHHIDSIRQQYQNYLIQLRILVHLVMENPLIHIHNISVSDTTYSSH
jgi:hypothetical protein